MASRWTVRVHEGIERVLGREAVLQLLDEVQEMRGGCGVRAVWLLLWERAVRCVLGLGNEGADLLHGVGLVWEWQWQRDFRGFGWRVERLRGCGWLPEAFCGRPVDRL